VLPAELVSLAIEVAEEGLAAGELPIGAVVVMGDDVLGRSWTRERAAGRRLVHADLLAMEQADRALGWSKRRAPLQLAVNLEPCLMCVGAAMALLVDEICYGLESSGDGAGGLAASWQPDAPDMTFSHIPPVTGGIHRDQCRDQFARYVRAAPASGFRTWAERLARAPG
jgi:tRNA(adenine34) deaminase